MKAAASAPGTPSIPRVSKGELRAQVEKLELVVITLQAEGKETNRTAKAAASRIAELEDQVARLEKRAASQSAPTPATQTPVKPPRKKRRSRDIDPGDAVPPGIAVEEPAPLDEEAEAAPENLEEHLGQR
jgi:chromosome segregation ATPase